jgi:hypothetical protein
MTFYKTLENSIGELLLLKTQLYWYDGRGWDNHPGRVCLIIDAAERAAVIEADASVPGARSAFNMGSSKEAASVLLLIDGSLGWVWIDKQSAELIASEPV